MNIDELEPGRELDALVAEKVMGKHYGKSPKYLERHRMAYERHEHGETYAAIAEDMGISTSRTQQLAHRWARALRAIALQKSAPPFSTDIAAAWQIVEKVQARFSQPGPRGGRRGCEFQISAALNSGVRQAILLAVVLYPNQKVITRSFSDVSVPHAICKAALKIAINDHD